MLQTVILALKQQEGRDDLPMEVVSMEESHKDFFISYNKADRSWAEWIAWQFEEAGYTVVVQAWDFLAGSNFVLEMHKAAIQAKCTIALLSPDYLKALYTQPEWAAAFVQDPTGAGGKLIPVRVRTCKPQGMLAAISYIDLVGIENEEEARKKLLHAISRQRAKPENAPPFPTNVRQEYAIPPRFPGTLPALWNVPHHQNMFFTGREDILEHLHDTLATHKTTALTQPQAINGLGGIGKTQTAVEYAYRYHNDYQAVLWIQAESVEVLVSDFFKLAALLDLPEKDEPDEALIIQAVKVWLRTHNDWLLILDNVENIEQIESYLPQGSGHILLTTRASVTEPLAQSIQLNIMTEEEAVTFLLRRVKLIALDAPVQNADENILSTVKKIVKLMDGLPLALDQAGAYILETGCDLSDYLNLYNKQGAELLKRRGKFAVGHADPVATTWSLSFKKIQQASSDAIHLLEFCAFLYPDAIPEELLTVEVPEMKPSKLIANALAFDEAVATLQAYSLVHRHPQTHMLSIHRLVQSVLKETLSKKRQLDWINRLVHTLDLLFPSGEPETWSQCERYFPQVWNSIELIKQYHITSSDAVNLLHGAYIYLRHRGRFQEAIPIAQHALAIDEQTLGLNHLGTAESLHNLAMLYQEQGDYNKAEPLYQRALAICEQVLGPTHPDTATVIDSLGGLYREQGDYNKAEPLLQRALSIREQILGPNHPDTARGLNNLAMLYQEQGDYNKAEPLLQRALTIWEQVLGPTHPDTARGLNNLAMLYREQGDYNKAEPLLQRALSIYEQALGPTHPDTATIISNLAAFYLAQRDYNKAESLFQRALTIYEQVLGPTHPDTATIISNLAAFYLAQRDYNKAEPLLQRALTIYEQVLGPTHPDTARGLNNLAMLYREQRDYNKAEPLLQRALSIWEQVLGPTHPDTAAVISNLAILYLQQGNYNKAESLFQRALTIWEQALGSNHSTTIAHRNIYETIRRNSRSDR